MKVIREDIITCFDVDDTLISYGGSSIGIVQGVFIQHVDPIVENIEALKKHKKWGQHIVVWSRSGHKWAEAVVIALKLEKYVDQVMCKPLFYYDDIPVEKWMGSPRWGGDKR